MVLPIRNQHEDLVLAFFASERPGRCADGLGDGRALHRNDIRVDRIQKQLRGAIVQCERTECKAATRERDQADPVAFEPVDKGLDLKQRARQPIGTDVFREHAQRRVQGDHDFDTLAMQEFEPHPVPGLRQCDDQKEESENRQRRLHPLPLPTRGRGQACASGPDSRNARGLAFSFGRRSRKTARPQARTTGTRTPERRQNAFQGILRNRVLANISSTPSKARPGQRKCMNNSE